MQNVSCPSCGGPVAFRSSASVMAVCEFCRSTLLKDAEAVRDLGKMSAVLEDYSPIQIGTSGVFEGEHFTVIGRIQLRYSEGMWNEWSVLFNDGKAGWLSDASGSYAFTSDNSDQEAPPPFEQLKPGQTHEVSQMHFTVADVRVAECTGGQGELPFNAGKGWQVRAADLRCGEDFITLDYSDEGQVKAYRGRTLRLSELNCQLLRETEQIKESISRYDRRVQAMNCPACGASMRFVPGATIHLACSGCHAQVDTSGEVAEVLEAGKRVESVPFTLSLGHQSKVDDETFTVIGAMRRADKEKAEWSEYLLHHPREGFMWLVESKSGWMRGKVCDRWPVWNGSDTATLGGDCFKRACDYEAQVTFAIGAFNWRVRVGESNRVIQFELGEMELTAEINAHEMTWSLGTRFGEDKKEAHSAPSTETEDNQLVPTALVFVLLAIALNITPLSANFWDAIFPLALLLGAIYLPAAVHDSSEEGGSGWDTSSNNPPEHSEWDTTDDSDNE